MWKRKQLSTKKIVKLSSSSFRALDAGVFTAYISLYIPTVCSSNIDGVFPFHLNIPYTASDGMSSYVRLLAEGWRVRTIWVYHRFPYDYMSNILNNVDWKSKLFYSEIAFVAPT